MRRLAGTRKVGHAGTLDPMATGVLVLGIGRATRLLGHLALDRKAYVATILLGRHDRHRRRRGRGRRTLDASRGHRRRDRAPGVAELTGAIQQVPSSVSAVKVDGKRAYARVRAGEQVEIAAGR